MHAHWAITKEDHFDQEFKTPELVKENLDNVQYVEAAKDHFSGASNKDMRLTEQTTVVREQIDL